MKLRSIICASAVAAAMAASATTTVTGTKTFARLPVSSTFESTIIALPFRGCGEAEMEIYVTNLVQTTNLTDGDTLLWKNASGNWLGWEFNGTAWQAIRTANQTAYNAGVPAEETAIPCGQACWLNRSNAATQPVFYLYGEVNASKRSVEVAAGTGTKPIYTIVGYPYEAAPLDLATWTGGEEGDTILVPEAGNNFGYKEYRRGASKWQVSTATTTTKTNPRTGKTTTVVTGYTYADTTDTIAAGLGFMYGRLADTAATLTWD